MNNNKDKGQPTWRRGADLGFNTAIGLQSQFEREMLDKAIDGFADELRASITRKIDGQLFQQTLAKKQGFVVEGYHAGSYNIEAAAKGAKGYYATAKELAGNDPLVDVRVFGPVEDNFKDFQAKFMKDGETTAKALSYDKYRANDIGKIGPSEQLDEVKQYAHRQALRNQSIRPQTSQNYLDTVEKAGDTVYHPDKPDITSRPLTRKGPGGSEDLTKQLDAGQDPQYVHADSARLTNQMRHYGNAAKVGAFGGFVAGAGQELITCLRKDGKMTRDEWQAVVERMVVSTAAGAGKALLTSGVQHAGRVIAQESSKGALRAVGNSLSKGTVAASVANLVVHLGNDLYKFQQGQIDGIELAESTLSKSTEIVAGTAGFAAGTALAGKMSGLIATSVAEYAVAGTTLGALGPVGLGIAGAIGATLVVSSYVGHFKGKGQKLAMADIDDAAKLLQQGGEQALGTYVGKISEMSEFRLQWSDILPLSGTFSVLGEYSARKRQLVALKEDIKCRLDKLPKQEVKMLAKIEAQYEAKLVEVEAHFYAQHQAVIAQAEDAMADLADELDDHLAVQFALDEAGRRKQVMLWDQYDELRERSTAEQRRREGYIAEIQSLQQELLDADQLKTIDRERLRTILADRSKLALPLVTPYDQASRFLYGAAAESESEWDIDKPEQWSAVSAKRNNQ